MIRKITYPAMNVFMLEVKRIIANDYNPNCVPSPEMELLKKSIEEDGYTQPIVVYKDNVTNMYIIVDGFHRYKCAIEYFDLDRIPAVVIEKDVSNRMVSTIRHNRARGVHQIQSMSSIVLELVSYGWSDDKIRKNLGMTQDELIRLKQCSGLKMAFNNQEFSKSWEEYETKRKK